MVNRRGIVRIIEATLAIIIIAGVLFAFFNQQKVQVMEESDSSERARNILEELGADPELREAVLIIAEDRSGGTDEAKQRLKTFFDEKIPEENLKYKYRVCRRVGEACGIEYKPTQIYSAERSVSSTLDRVGPVKIRLFVWERYEGEDDEE